jgi:hypothetical protein
MAEHWSAIISPQDQRGIAYTQLLVILRREQLILK